MVLAPPTLLLSPGTRLVGLPPISSARSLLSLPPKANGHHHASHYTLGCSSLPPGTKELALPPRPFRSSLPPKVLVPSFPLFTNYLWTVVLLFFFFLFNVNS